MYKTVFLKLETQILSNNNNNAMLVIRQWPEKLDVHDKVVRSRRLGRDLPNTLLVQLEDKQRETMFVYSTSCNEFLKQEKDDSPAQKGLDNIFYH